MNKNEIRRNLGILYQEESDKGLTHPFFILILNAFTEEAKAHGYDVTFIHHPLEGLPMYVRNKYMLIMFFRTYIK